MFRNLVLILFVFLGGFLSAQGDEISPLDKEIQELSQAYQLDQHQNNQLGRVLARKQQMLNDIESFKTSNFDQFLALRRSIYKGTEGSIKLILKKEQITFYEEEAMRKRKLISDRVKELKAQGAEKQQLIDASMGIEW